MENLKELTPTELLKTASDIKAKHEQLKEDIETATYQLESLEASISVKLVELVELEKNYVLVVEEIDNR